MRYAVIAAFAGLAVALPWTETVYDTKVFTITSCAPDVTDCPGKKSVVPTTSTTCTEEIMKSSTSPMPIYVNPSSTAPVVSSAKPTTTAPAPYVPATTSSASKETTTVAPPPYYPVGPVTVNPAPVPSASASASHPASKPSSIGTMSTGVVPSKPSASASAVTSAPATYSGAASQLEVGALLGLGAVAALFL